MLLKLPSGKPRRGWRTMSPRDWARGEQAPPRKAGPRKEGDWERKRKNQMMTQGQWEEIQVAISIKEVSRPHPKTHAKARLGLTGGWVVTVKGERWEITRNWGTIREDSNIPDPVLSLCYKVKAPNIPLAGISLVLESGIGSMFGS